MRIASGIAPQHLDRAAALYWQAFGTKLGIVLGPKEKGIAYVRRVLDSSHALTAISDSGNLLGVAGFKTHEGALVGGDYSDLAAIYDRFSALWRAKAASLIERDTENERFLMDAIFVAREARGHGVGTALLHAFIAEGARRGYASVRLDVIDTNTRARALYERVGFKALKTDNIGVLRHVFRFTSATTMVRSTQPLPGGPPVDPLPTGG